LPVRSFHLGEEEIQQFDNKKKVITVREGTTTSREVEDMWPPTLVVLKKNQFWRKHKKMPLVWLRDQR